MPHHARLLGSLVIVLLTVIGLAGLVGPAHAATPDDDRIRAEKLIQEGLTLARGKQFREAIPKFEAALKLYPHPETKHNLGRAHEEVGELKKAIAACEKAGDYVSRDMLLVQLEDTEMDHAYYLEKQLRLIDAVGLPNYLQSQMGSGAPQA